ncbi:membrane protein involved in the export of O-antigen and teichoic acid [Thermoplasmatales archaeon SCGC AB-539-C06]|nr:membrane protein involved in the export of O-antigen and teichoic acid [Thermoplasmatales archaeon SCGC AB-539-C06]
MNTIKRIASNTGILLISQIISYAIGFFFIIYTARYLGAEGFGIISFALAFNGIFIIFTELGLSQLTVREVAREKSLANKYLDNIIGIKLILAIFTFGLIAFTINLLAYPMETVIVVYLISLSAILNSFSRTFYSIFQAYEKLIYRSCGQILESVLMLSGALFAIFQGFSIIDFAFIYFIVSLIVLGYCFIVSIWKFIKPKIKICLSFWKNTIKEAIPFGLSGVFVIIYYRIDTVMLSLMENDTVVGWYNVPYRLISVLLFLPGAFFASFYPVMSRLHTKSKEDIKFAYETSLRYMGIIAFPTALGINLFADRIIILIFGDEYISSIPALRILSWAVFFYVSFLCDTFYS